MPFSLYIDLHISDIHSFFFFNDTATTEIYTLSLHDALPICHVREGHRHGLAHAVALVAETEDEEGEAPAVGRGEDVEGRHGRAGDAEGQRVVDAVGAELAEPPRVRSEEHTSELQSHSDLVCR